MDLLLDERKEYTIELHRTTNEILERHTGLPKKETLGNARRTTEKRKTEERKRTIQKIKGIGKRRSDKGIRERVATSA